MLAYWRAVSSLELPRLDFTLEFCELIQRRVVSL